MAPSTAIGRSPPRSEVCSGFQFLRMPSEVPMAIRPKLKKRTAAACHPPRNTMMTLEAKSVVSPSLLPFRTKTMMSGTGVNKASTCPNRGMTNPATKSPRVCMVAMRMER